MTTKTLSSFRETAEGYEATSNDGEHIYRVTFNGIDYSLFHYWSHNPVGELLSLSTTTPTRDARAHYAELMGGRFRDERLSLADLREFLGSD